MYCDAAKLLGAAEEPPDGVALSVASGGVGAWVAALTTGRNHGAGTAGSERGREWIRIVAPVGHELGWARALEQRQGLRGVVALAGRQAAPGLPG